MLTDRWLARIIGVMFIVGTVTAVAGGMLLTPIEESSYLTEVAAAEGRMVSGFFLEFVLVLSLFGIGFLMFPILRRQNEPMALGYFASRAFEAVILFAGAAAGLLVLTLSQDHGDAAGVLPVGDALVASREWALLLGGLVALGISAMILNTLLYQARLVPTWLTVWGFAAGALILVRGVIAAYGVEFSGLMQALFAAPIALQEMVFAVRLIWKGFDQTPEPEATETVRLEIDIREHV